MAIPKSKLFKTSLIPKGSRKQVKPVRSIQNLKGPPCWVLNVLNSDTAATTHYVTMTISQYQLQRYPNIAYTNFSRRSCQPDPCDHLGQGRTFPDIPAEFQQYPIPSGP